MLVNSPFATEHEQSAGGHAVALLVDDTTTAPNPPTVNAGVE
jgi:hypothetical protein